MPKTSRTKKKRKNEFFQLSEDELLEKIQETKNEVKRNRNLMKTYEENEQYLEAAKQKRKIEILKQRLIDLSEAKFSVKQKNDNENLIKIGEDNEKQFEKTWEEKTELYIQKMKASFDKLQKRQEVELQNLKDKIEKRKLNPRTSSLLLGLRLKQSKLAKSGRYIEAENIRRNANIIEQEQCIESSKKNQKANQRLLDTLYEKHQMEIDALKQKFDSEKRKLNETKSRDHKKMINRLRKMTRDIEKKHIAEVAKSRKNLSLASSKMKIPKIKGIPSKFTEYNKSTQSARTTGKESIQNQEKNKNSESLEVQTAR